ncbi:MAG TPA: low-specificity L-threonine aldolase [Thermomicrobiales bacterium]|nr:low-specificity L-threonine aldolase [Thermomicrobiales bacterium]
MIDLRSDTVTRPTDAMRQAMASAEVGDDQYGEDPTVTRLEQLAARMLGKEAAVFVASGTMGNLAALLAHCGRGDEIIMGDECHIFWYESGGAAALGGMPFSLVPNRASGELDLDIVRQRIRAKRPGYPPTGVICVENTQNRCGGTVVPVEHLAELREIADEHGIPVHMDGARIFNAAAGSDTPVERIASYADTVQFCLSKGLAAPVGSLVAGSDEFIQRARGARKILGGAMRQSGVIAAAGLVALESMVERLPEDHRRARRLAEALAEINGITIDLEAVQTNIVIFKTEPAVEQTAFVERMKSNGVLVSNYGARGVRMVTHYQVDDAAIDRAIEAARSVMAGQPAAA